MRPPTTTVRRRTFTEPTTFHRRGPFTRSSFHPIVGANEQQRYGAPDVETLPILSFSDPPHVKLRGWGFDVDVGDRSEEWTATFDSSFFFEKAMTFHGRASTVTNGPEHRRIHATELECVAQFSHDLQFIRAGYIRWKWDPVRYPLDGTWKVSWTSDADASATITVCAHTFQHGGTYQIDSESNGSSHTPRFEWPSADGTLPAVVQTSNVSIPPGTFGPNVGEEIRWTTTSTDERYQTIVWTRLSRNSTKVLSLASPFTPIVYRVPTENDPLSDIPPHNPNGIWGNVFCQANSVGLASYHFDPDSFRNACTDDAATNVNVNVNANAAMRTPTEVSAYISYENPHTRVWPALDNGAPIPARVPFRRVSWDPGERLFRGEICWVEDFQTTWQGCAKWCYRIKFDSSFTCIVSGGCSQYGLARRNISDSSIPQALPLKVHLFGEELVYISARIEDYIAKEMTDSPQMEQAEFARLALRWHEEGASRRTLEMFTRVWTAMRNGRSGIIS
mmetsp:Transcript_22819/g.27907  ORF Transcript_22819/g.27907 Transcript_22819/m.27907 type:complete len:505 (+) Transcript_22819:270-1784(+)